GSGIFVSPAIAAREAGAPGLALVVWIVAGIVATSGALCYAELAAAIPETGGTYVFLQRAYRAPLIAFLFGWAGFFASFPGPIAAVATAFAESATVILGPILPYGPLEKRILAVSVILVLTAVNFVSAAGGGRLQNVATFLKVLALALVVVVGLLLGHPDLGR